MVNTLTGSTFRPLLCLGLLLALLAGSLPAGATLPSWQEVTAVNQEGLLAAARKYLSPQEAILLEQAIRKEERYGTRHKGEYKPPLVPIKQRGFIRDVINMVKPYLARGDSARVKQFFKAINRQKLIRGYGQYYLRRGGYGGPMVVQLELQQSSQKEFQVEVWYRLVHPAIKDGKKQEGHRRIYLTGITGP